QVDALLQNGPLKPFFLIFDVASGDFVELESASGGVNMWWDAIGWLNTLIYKTTHPLTFNFVEDFTLMQGRPWVYLTKNNDDTDETQMIVNPDNGIEWVRSNDYHCRCGPDGHQVAGENYKSVRRWPVPVAMTIRVHGGCSLAQQGGGVWVRILHNTTVK